jgi:hypothetical protein
MTDDEILGRSELLIAAILSYLCRRGKILLHPAFSDGQIHT